MFAYDCIENRGSHIGACVDGLYFGSCCKLPKGMKPSDLTVSNQIAGMKPSEITVSNQITVTDIIAQTVEDISALFSLGRTKSQ